MQAPSPRPRLRSALGGALVVALMATGCSEPYVAPRPSAPATTRDESAAASTLVALERALSAGDADGAGSLAADDRVRRQLAAAATNVRRVRLVDIRLRYLASTGAQRGDGEWTASAELSWRYAGYDDGVARREVEVAFTADGESVARLGGGGAATPIWAAGPVAVARGPRYLVVSRGGAARTERLARLARAAVDSVGATLGGAPSVVLEAPRSAAELHRALAAGAHQYDAVAAVTAPVDGSVADDAPVHVLINPGEFDPLDRVAAQVVVTHETVHAVTRAPLAVGAPLWLVEGFADYVALREVDLPTTRTAGQISAQARRNGVPDRLPEQAAFNTSAEHLGAQYEAAWLACVVIADRAGEAALIALYDDVLTGADLDAALRRRAGWTVEELTREWRARIATVAGLSQ
ncbi:hypothetical protein E8D34_03175 [Nocardioides sp. GY 10113]|uniref:hypothetical protein n=1 Tax=Nocardioides sp. GY 10113 TaxID=2569761 RepID=UPI0010A7A0AE|nr:hypothetical protein [Nocardioides sp. GY 10113]TIC88690.1 hypothetical protein E8D34_03175 [Nocardioides sp. GY 10113]